MNKEELLKELKYREELMSKTEKMFYQLLGQVTLIKELLEKNKEEVKTE